MGTCAIYILCRVHNTLFIFNFVCIIIVDTSSFLIYVHNLSQTFDKRFRPNLNNVKIFFPQALYNIGTYVIRVFFF